MKFNLDLQETGTIIAIPFIVFVFLAPMLGLFLDKIGYRCYILILGYSCLFLSQMIFMGYDVCPANDKCYEGIAPMAITGLSSAVIQLTLFTSINYVVPEKFYGTAYGIA
jgi:MFS family permease